MARSNYFPAKKELKKLDSSYRWIEVGNTDRDGIGRRITIEDFLEEAGVATGGDTTSDTSGGITSILLGNIIYVDSSSGNDGNAITAGNYDFTKPFATLQAAYAAAVAGDTIFVRPGTYSTYDASTSTYDATIGTKSGVNIHVQDATIDWYFNAEGQDDAIYNITGNGVFTKTEDDGFNTFRIRADRQVFSLQCKSVLNTSDSGDCFSFASTSSAEADAVTIRLRVSDSIHSEPQYAIGLTRAVKGTVHCPMISALGVGGTLFVSSLMGDVEVNGDVLSSTGDNGFTSCVTMSAGTHTKTLTINGDLIYDGPSDDATAGAISGISGTLVLNGSIRTPHHAVNQQFQGSNITVNGDIETTGSSDPVVVNSSSASFTHKGKIISQGSSNIINIVNATKVKLTGTYTNNGTGATDQGINLNATTTDILELDSVHVELASASADSITSTAVTSISYIRGLSLSNSVSPNITINRPHIINP